MANRKIAALVLLSSGVMFLGLSCIPNVGTLVNIPRLLGLGG